MPAPRPVRSPDEIRASIESNRVQLGTSLEKLRQEVVEADRLAMRSCGATSAR